MSDEKNEKPTDKKIEDAREKGQVPVSRDLARLVSLTVVAELVFMSEPIWREAISSLMNLALMFPRRPFIPALIEIMTAAGWMIVVVIGTFFVVCPVVGTIAFWGQFGILISPEALEPKFDKLNPVNGIKQLFSLKKLIELGTSLFKATLIGWIIYTSVRSELPAIIHLSGGEPKDIYIGFLTMLRSIFHVVIGLCVCLGMMDFALQKYFHTKELMMSMEDIKREYKESEGDPLIKGQRKQLARQWAMSGPAAETKKANAVVVNPTHFAVALRYDPDEAPVPIVLTKGKDEIAQAIIASAKESGIPVIRHVWLARTLYATCRPDTVIPRASYEAVAYVYAVVNELHAMNEVGREVELESYGDPPDTHKA